jgi:hypothetical protein
MEVALLLNYGIRLSVEGEGFLYVLFYISGMGVTMRVSVPMGSLEE